MASKSGLAALLLVTAAAAAGGAYVYLRKASALSATFEIWDETSGADVKVPGGSIFVRTTDTVLVKGTAPAGSRVDLYYNTGPGTPGTYLDTRTANSGNYYQFEDVHFVSGTDYFYFVQVDYSAYAGSINVTVQ